MIVIKDNKAIDKMRIAGHALARIMDSVYPLIVEGKNTLEIDAFIEKSMHEHELRPECKGYAGYCHSSCISLNDVVVHGVPSAKIVLKSGDFVKIDVVGSYNGYCADLARYYFVGEVQPVVKKIAATAQRALDKAIEVVAPGKRLSKISGCIQKEVERAGFGVVRDFAGHGIGKTMHEAPEIPNYLSSGDFGPMLREGMTLAIEPMITEKDYKVRVADDGWTVKTVDGGLAGHVEDTVVVTSYGAEILTRI